MLLSRQEGVYPIQTGHPVLHSLMMKHPARGKLRGQCSTMHYARNANAGCRRSQVAHLDAGRPWTREDGLRLRSARARARGTLPGSDPVVGHHLSPGHAAHRASSNVRRVLRRGPGLVLGRKQRLPDPLPPPL